MHPLHGNDVERWRREHRAAMEALERVRIQELRDMTEERAQEIMRSLVCAGKPWRARPDWSGLVEQQAMFMRARKK